MLFSGMVSRVGVDVGTLAIRVYQGSREVVEGSREQCNVNKSGIYKKLIYPSVKSLLHARTNTVMLALQQTF